MAIMLSRTHVRRTVFTETPAWRPEGVGSGAAATDRLCGLLKSLIALCLGFLNNKARKVELTITAVYFVRTFFLTWTSGSSQCWQTPTVPKSSPKQQRKIDLQLAGQVINSLMSLKTIYLWYNGKNLLI